VRGTVRERGRRRPFNKIVSCHVKTYPLKREDGSLQAFEIPMPLIPWSTSGTLCDLLERLDGVANVDRNGRGDYHVTFTYRGEPFVIWEPFGDNSRYWVGPEHPARSNVDVESLHAAFERLDTSVRGVLATAIGVERT
jgi:hypothetical protein